MRNLTNSIISVRVIFAILMVGILWLGTFGRATSAFQNLSSHQLIERGIKDSKTHSFRLEDKVKQSNHQEIRQTETSNLKLILTRVKLKYDVEGNPVEIESEEVLQTIFVPIGEFATKDMIVAKSFKQYFLAKEYFRVKIENRSANEWFVYVNAKSPGEECGNSGSQDSQNEISKQISSEKTRYFPDEQVLFTNDKASGEVSFVILASRQERTMRELLNSFDFLFGDSLAGGSRANSVINLKEIDALELKGGVSKGKEDSSRKITITLGNVYSQSGQSLKSADFYDALLQINCFPNKTSFREGRVSKISFNEVVIGWLNNRALANYQTGNLGRSKSDYEESLNRLIELRKTDNKPHLSQEAVILTNLAQVYATLGEQKEAIKRYEQALTILKQEREEPETIKRNRYAAVYNGLGTSHEFIGEYIEAENFYRQALDIERALGQKASEGITVNSLARLSMNKNDYPKAENLFNQSLKLSLDAENPAGVASAYNNLGLLYLKQNKPEAAKINFLKASEILRQLKNQTARATILSNLMFVEQKQQRPQIAVFYGKQAVNILQEVRGEISGIDRDLQRSFLLSREETYRNLADLLVSEGRLPEAQAVLNLLKDGEYEQLARSGEKADTVPYSQTETESISKIENLVALERERGELQKLLGANGEISAEQNDRLEKLRLDIAAANKAFDVALGALGKTEISVKGRVADIQSGKELQSALTELAEKTNSGVVALYTVLGTEEEKDAAGKPVADKTKTKFGWVIMVTENRYTAYPIDVNNLEKNVFAFRDALSSDKYDPQPLAKKIYTAIFRQTSPKLKKTLEQDLQDYLKTNKDKTLMWSLDGVLRYIPMAALHDGKRYLVENYRHTLFTKESFLSLKDDTQNVWKALGLGVSDARPNFSALSGVKTELETIVREAGKPTGILNGSIKLNNDFKMQTFFNVIGSGAFPVVHISSHYNFDLGRMENSYLLAGDGNLTFKDISEQKNLFKKVDLLTLSACDTGVSGNGKEAEGFAYLAQSLGAKSVIASLWKVSDAGTPELMIQFYKLRAENPQMSKGEAFRQAQMEMLGAETSNLQTSDKKRSTTVDLRGQKVELPAYVKDPKHLFAHPHYWSSFVLIGNWR